MLRDEPASSTKHIGSLSHSLAPSDDIVVLCQDDRAGTTTGATVWLGAQVLSIYLHRLYGSLPPEHGRSAIELGAGTGLVSLKLASLGFTVHATDVDDVLDRVLSFNIAVNIESHPRWTGTCRSLKLDWTDEALPEAIKAAAPFSLIAAADCVFDSAHVDPLLRTISHLASISPGVAVLIAVERRDSALIDSFLERARAYDLDSTKIPRPKLRKLIIAAYGWAEEDWSDVEVWKLKPKRAST